MSHFCFSLVPVGISVGIIAMLILMIPSFTDGMQIKVETDATKLIKKNDLNVEVEGTDNVATLKTKINEAIGIAIPIVEQTLRLNNTFGLVLEDIKTMKECGIKNDQIIFLSLGEFQIKVRYGEKTHSVNVKSTDTVATLKGRIEKIAEFGNIPPKNQILRLGKAVLKNDSERMDKCKIGQDETVEVSFEEGKSGTSHPKLAKTKGSQTT